jgi:hypothetical protein
LENGHSRSPDAVQPSRKPAQLTSCLVVDVNPHVKQAVIPIRMMVAAPLTLLVKLCDIFAHLAAVVAILGGIAVYFGLGAVKALPTFIGPR